MKPQESADVILFYVMRWNSLGNSHPGMLPQKDRPYQFDDLWLSRKQNELIIVKSLYLNHTIVLFVALFSLFHSKVLIKVTIMFSWILFAFLFTELERIIITLKKNDELKEKPAGEWIFQIKKHH